MSKKLVELKPCPFCGGVAELYEHKTFINPLALSGFYIKCQGCKVTTAYYKTAKEAIKKWNRRANNG